MKNGYCFYGIRLNTKFSAGISKIENLFYGCRIEVSPIGTHLCFIL